MIYAVRLTDTESKYIKNFNRTKGNSWGKEIHQNLGDLNYHSVSKVIEILQDASEGIDNPILEIDTVEQYGDTRIVVSVNGTRPATPEELKSIKAELLRLKSADKDLKSERIERLRKELAELEASI